MTSFTEWTAEDAAACHRGPAPHDDKYSRGVLGVVAGSARYPGAAVLVVEAAARTGLGMVRYLGPELPTLLVLQRRPEAVPDAGRANAWTLGSGMDPADPETPARLAAPLASGLPLVLDAGALGSWPEAAGPVVLTPHHGEAARLLGVERAEVSADAEAAVLRLAELTGSTVLLKGPVTYVAGAGRRIRVSGAPASLATAGTGDVLAGILGALLATHPEPDLPELTATAARLHAEAALRAGSPLAALDLTAHLPRG